jgi:cysteine desulfuration protein SufE
MSETENGLTSRLQEIVEDFEWCEGREKVEMLIQFAQDMPGLPDWMESDHANMDQVHECMTPVFVQSETKDGKMRFYFDVPESSPTVRGLASILGQGLEDATPEEILRVPGDFYLKMGLQDVLTHQRLNGFFGILAHMKRLAMKELSGD